MVEARPLNVHLNDDMPEQGGATWEICTTVAGIRTSLARCELNL